MKKNIIILFVLMSGLLSAQKYAVVEKGGEKYYVHTVEQGNTLYAISKLYGVDVAYIEESNENVQDGLSVGEKVLVPIKFRDRKFNKKPKPVLKDDFIIHTVYKKETLYSISKHYRISENDLLDANPSIQDGLKRGEKVVIPLDLIKPAKESHLQAAGELEYPQHNVEKGQTLYAISKMYKVTVEEILEVNPGLTNNLGTGSVINIPIQKEETITEEVEDKDSLHVDFDEIRVKNIALLLPFEFKDLDSLGDNQSRRNAFAMIDLAIEFYRGAKLACEKFTEEGGSVNLMVFDMKNVPGIVEKCMIEGWLNDADAVIGPFHKKTFNELAKKLKGSGKIHVSPNLRSSSILKNEDVFKVNPDAAKEIDFLAKSIVDKHFMDNIVLVKSDIQRDQNMIKAMESRLNKYLSEQDDRLFDQVNVVNTEEEGPREKRVLSMQKSFFKDTNNVVIAPSNNLSFVSDALTKLNRVYSEKKPLQVYGFESWSNFDNIDVNYKQNFNLKLCSTKNLNYENAEVRRFMRSYFRKHETIPSDKGYAFLSYDISRFLLMSLDEYGNQAFKNLDKVEHDFIYQNIRPQRTNDGSWTNTGFYFLQHKDYKLLKAKNE